MSYTSTLDIVVDTIREVSDMKQDVSLDTTLSDLDLDSLDLLEITIALEEKLGIEIDQDLDIKNMRMFNFVAYIEEAQSKS